MCTVGGRGGAFFVVTAWSRAGPPPTIIPSIAQKKFFRCSCIKVKKASNQNTLPYYFCTVFHILFIVFIVLLSLQVQ
jgi:hypothetical protein